MKTKVDNFFDMMHQKNLEQQMQEQGPEVGLFYVLPGNDIQGDTTPLRDIHKEMGGIKSPEVTHTEFWTKFRQANPEYKNDEPYDWPRGRVCYNTETKKFELQADEKIIGNPLLLDKILFWMKIPRARAECRSDWHYTSKKG